MRKSVAVALFAVAFSAFGHDGEDHGAPPPPVNQAVAPRAVAATEEFEAVAVLEGKKLVIYVDVFASNEPVTKAKVEVEGAGLKGTAVEAAPGTYVMDAAAILPPGKHGLTIGIEAGDTADLLSTTLDTSAPDQGEVHAHGWNERVIWIVAVLLLLAGGLLLAVQRGKIRARGL